MSRPAAAKPAPRGWKHGQGCAPWDTPPLPCAGDAARLSLPKGEVLLLPKGDNRGKLSSMPREYKSAATSGLPAAALRSFSEAGAMAGATPGMGKPGSAGTGGCDEQYF